jgi:hypothetical protein
LLVYLSRLSELVFFPDLVNIDVDAATKAFGRPPLPAEAGGDSSKSSRLRDLSLE